MPVLGVLLWVPSVLCGSLSSTRRARGALAQALHQGGGRGHAGVQAGDGPGERYPQCQVAARPHEAPHALAFAASPRREYRFALPDCPAYGGVYGLEFVRDFLAGREVPVSGVDVLRVLEILDAAYASAAQERVVAVSTASLSLGR